MTDDTSRRERAEKWAEANVSSPLYSHFCEDAYLAGALEEAAIKDAEIERLRVEIGELDLVLQSQTCNIERVIKEKDAEIAALHHRIGELEKQNDADRQDFSAEIAALHEALTLEAASHSAAEIAALREAIKDFLCECALVDKFRRYETWQITPGSMDELRKMVEVEP